MYKKAMICAVTLIVSNAVGANESPRDFRSVNSVSKAMAAQASGDISSEKEQHLSGKARSASYKRYVDSFAQPIPESFIDKNFNNKK
ncbi:DUF3613 domain-containing protein [Spongiibacter tropicus]|uniref:DUF3613 domain-containing protein n=1 Tax=Spongiibacter tropicus TaxID=454602 RepID=UPI0035BE9D38